MTAPVPCPDCDGPLPDDARRCPFCQRALATRRCDACRARALVVATVCACGAPLSEKSATGLADATCPVCDVVLAVQTVQGIRLHECGACAGLFFDRESFAKATDDPETRASLHFRGSIGTPYRGSSVPAPSGEAPARDRFYRRCPACRTVMSRVNFGRRSAVFVDVCPRHGTWLDEDELVRVLAFVERGGLEAARAAEATEREKEAAQARQGRTAARVSLASEPEPESAWKLQALLDGLFGLLGWR